VKSCSPTSPAGWRVKNLPALTAPGYDAGGHQSYAGTVHRRLSEAEGVGGPWQLENRVGNSGTGGGGQGVLRARCHRPGCLWCRQGAVLEFTDRRRRGPGQRASVGRDPEVPDAARPPPAPPRSSGSPWCPAASTTMPTMAIPAPRGKPAPFPLDLGKKRLTEALARGRGVLQDLLARRHRPPCPRASSTSQRPRASGAGEVQHVYLGDPAGHACGTPSFAVNGTAGWNLDTLSFFEALRAPRRRPCRFMSPKTDLVWCSPSPPRRVLPAWPNGGAIVLVRHRQVPGGRRQRGKRSSTQKQSVYALLDTRQRGCRFRHTPAAPLPDAAAWRRARRPTPPARSSAPAFTWGRATSDAETTQRSGSVRCRLSRPGAERQVRRLRHLGHQAGVWQPAFPRPGCRPLRQRFGATRYFANLATGSGSRSISQVGLLPVSPTCWNLVTGSSAWPMLPPAGAPRPRKARPFLQGSEGIQVVVGDGAGGAFTNESIIGRLSWPADSRLRRTSGVQYHHDAKPCARIFFDRTDDCGGHRGHRGRRGNTKLQRQRAQGKRAEGRAALIDLLLAAGAPPGPVRQLQGRLSTAPTRWVRASRCFLAAMRQTRPTRCRRKSARHPTTTCASVCKWSQCPSLLTLPPARSPPPARASAAAPEPVRTHAGESAGQANRDRLHPGGAAGDRGHRRHRHGDCCAQLHQLPAQCCPVLGDQQPGGHAQQCALRGDGTRHPHPGRTSRHRLDQRCRVLSISTDRATLRTERHTGHPASLPQLCEHRRPHRISVRTLRASPPPIGEP